MSEVIVFAGTTEGTEVCRLLHAGGVSVLACTATEYGGKVLKEAASESLNVQSGRLTEEEMEDLFRREKPGLVLDATHPYALEATANIRSACVQTGCSYQRVLRDTGSSLDGSLPATHAAETCVYVETAEAAADYLNQTDGGIFLTTGSKELSKFTAIKDFQSRLYARVLPLPAVISTCAELGLEGKHLIAMQGPFSKELNIAMLRQTGCRYLVTKETGDAGGFEEKLQAAIVCGATLVVIGRPIEEQGISLSICKQLLIDRYHIKPHPQITLVGIGMGSPENLTIEGQNAVRTADLIIGAERIADAVRHPRQAYHYEYRAGEICEYIRKHPEYERIVIALSGDVGFYSGAKKLLNELKTITGEICLLSGISSVSYFMSKLGLSWEDAKLASCHGRTSNLVSLIRQHRKVFVILGTGDGVAELARKLVFYEMGDVLFHVGENLSYKNETLLTGPASDFTGYSGSALSVLCVINSSAVLYTPAHGIRDDAFIRGKVPMTKEEVRAVSLSKLCLDDTAICYDIGAGTGSVSIEMAMRASQGHVYAIEKNPEAIELLEKNRKRFAADHLEIVSGTAPDVLEALPAPTHVFIGGSSGKLKEIIAVLLKKNPRVRIVINCITLETVTEAMQILRDQKFCYTEIVQVQVSRAKELGTYHLMTGENPIYIITCQNKED